MDKKVCIDDKPLPRKLEEYKEFLEVMLELNEALEIIKCDREYFQEENSKLEKENKRLTELVENLKKENEVLTESVRLLLDKQK